MLASLNLAGFENVFGILVFFIIIGRAIAAIRKAASGGKKPSAPRASSGKRKVEHDLENFFKNLAEQAGGQEKTSPPPPPVPTQSARTVMPPPPPAAARRTAAPVRRKRTVEPVKPVAQTLKVTQPRTVAAASFSITGMMPKRAGTQPGMSSQARQEIIGMLRDQDSIRKAVVLREILGPPVSMGSSSVSDFARNAKF